MQTIATPNTSAVTYGVAIRSAVKAGGQFVNHAEGIVVHSAVKAGGQFENHAEGIVVHSAVKAGGQFINHSESALDPREPTTTDPRVDGIVVEF